MKFIKELVIGLFIIIFTLSSIDAGEHYSSRRRHYSSKHYYNSNDSLLSNLLVDLLDPEVRGGIKEVWDIITPSKCSVKCNRATCGARSSWYFACKTKCQNIENCEAAFYQMQCTRVGCLSSDVAVECMKRNRNENGACQKSFCQKSCNRISCEDPKKYKRCSRYCDKNSIGACTKAYEVAKPKQAKNKKRSE